MKNKKQKASIAELERRLRAYKRQGARITLSGEDYGIAKIARACVEEEEGTYMGDYIFDASGKLLELRFDKVDIPK